MGSRVVRKFRIFLHGRGRPSSSRIGKFIIFINGRSGFYEERRNKNDFPRGWISAFPGRFRMRFPLCFRSRRPHAPWPLRRSRSCRMESRGPSGNGPSEPRGSPSAPRSIFCPQIYGFPAMEVRYRKSAICEEEIEKKFSFASVSSFPFHTSVIPFPWKVLISFVPGLNTFFSFAISPRLGTGNCRFPSQSSKWFLFYGASLLQIFDFNISWTFTLISEAERMYFLVPENRTRKPLTGPSCAVTSHSYRSCISLAATLNASNIRFLFLIKFWLHELNRTWTSTSAFAVSIHFRQPPTFTTFIPCAVPGFHLSSLSRLSFFTLTSVIFLTAFPGFISVLSNRGKNPTLSAAHGRPSRSKVLLAKKNIMNTWRAVVYAGFRFHTQELRSNSGPGKKQVYISPT